MNVSQGNPGAFFFVALFQFAKICQILQLQRSRFGNLWAFFPLGVSPISAGKYFRLRKILHPGPDLPETNMFVDFTIFGFFTHEIPCFQAHQFPKITIIMVLDLFVVKK